VAAALAIAKREWKAYFASPLGFVILILFSLLLGLFVYLWSPFGVPTLFARQSADLSGVFAARHLPLLFVLFGAAISMRLWSEERRLGTEELLLTLPVRPIDAVLGKFLGAMGMLVLCLATTLPTLYVVWSLCDVPRGLEWGPIFGGYAGSLALGATCVALGQLASAFTRDQLVAFLVGFTLLALWFFLGDLATNVAPHLPERFAGAVLEVKQYGLTALFDSVDRGLILVKNLVFLLSACALLLGLNAAVLTWRKAG
jgi:ABC-2 type transport system permease protein